MERQGTRLVMKGQMPSVNCWKPTHHWTTWMLHVWKRLKQKVERKDQTHENGNGQIVGLEKKERNQWERHGVNAKEPWSSELFKARDMKKDTFNGMNTIIIWISFKKTPRIPLITSCPKRWNSLLETFKQSTPLSSYIACIRCNRLVHNSKLKKGKSISKICVRWGLNPRLLRDQSLNLAPWTARPRALHVSYKNNNQ